MNNTLKQYPTILQAFVLGFLSVFFSFISGILIVYVVKSFNIKNEYLHNLIRLFGYSLPMLFSIRIGLRKYRNRNHDSLSFKFNKVAIIVFIVGIIIVQTIPIITDPFNIILPMPQFFKRVFATMLNFNIFNLMTIVLAAPVLEETLFRGVILNGLLKNHSPQKAIVVSALIFALIHLNPWQAIPAFFGGILIGWIYWKTNSIIPGMAMHFGINLCGMLITMKYGISYSLHSLFNLKSYLTLIILSALVLTAGVLFLKNHFRHTSYSENIEGEGVDIDESEMSPVSIAPFE